MEIGDTVLVKSNDPLDTADVHEAVVMGFAGDHVRVDWKVKKLRFWGLIEDAVERKMYVHRSLLKIVSFDDPVSEVSDNVSELIEELRSLGWFEFNCGKWTYGDHKELPIQGEVGRHEDGYKIEVKAETVVEFLQKGVRNLRG